MPDDARLPHHTVAGKPMRDLGALQTAELFVLSAVRLWGGGGADAPCRKTLVRNGFHAVNLSRVHYAAFAQLMSCIAGGAGTGRPFTTALSCCAPVMHDEAWLLECFALS